LKKVLVLAYDFPPLISIGAQRPYSWYKYFAENNIEVTVVTRQWNSNTLLPEDFVKPAGTQTTFEKDSEGLRTIIRTPFAPNLRDRLILKYGLTRFAVIRKLLSFVYSYLEHLLLIFDAKANIYHEADKLLQHEKFDCIIATGEPFILFKYAYLLSEKHHTPWVADYRDGWTTNQGNYTIGGLQKLLLDFYKSREKKYLSNCQLITTAAPEYAKALQLANPQKRVEVVYNGYDEDAFIDTENIVPPTDKFVISYAGIIYPHQNLEMFLKGLELFLDRHPNALNNTQVNFYGLESQPESKQRVLQLLPHATILNFTARMPYAEVIKKLKASHIQLLLSAKNANWLNAKVFDYLGTGRPIMLVENDNGILQQMVSMGNGVALNNITEVAEYLQAEYGKYKQGKPSAGLVSSATKQYTRKKQAELFVLLLNGLTK
jgi:glycosyltransferase involved in cell wall biosynthesis